MILFLRALLPSTLILLAAACGEAEYPPPTPEQVSAAERAIARIPQAEAFTESAAYFDPALHYVLANLYATAFIANTSNAVYMERMVTETVVAERLGHPKAPTALENIYSAFHGNRTPTNPFFPTSLSFERWRSLAEALSPQPESVGLVLVPLQQLRALRAAFEAWDNTSPELSLAFRAATEQYVKILRISTGRLAISTQRGRMYLTQNYYEEWAIAARGFGYAIIPASLRSLDSTRRNDIAIRESYLRAFPADATIIRTGQDRGLFSVAPNLVVVPGVRYFTDALKSFPLSNEAPHTRLFNLVSR